jgi:hypothetical protein
MSSMARHRRRAEARFANKAGGNLLAHLFEAGTRIEGRPFAGIITRAIIDFQHAPSGCCFACEGDYGRGAAFLVAHAAVKPTSAALAVACNQCWSREDYLEALSDAAELTLQKLLPGRWLEPLPTTPHTSQLPVQPEQGASTP